VALSISDRAVLGRQSGRLLGKVVSELTPKYKDLEEGLQVKSRARKERDTL
jgi:hypothetical protein